MSNDFNIFKPEDFEAFDNLNWWDKKNPLSGFIEGTVNRILNERGKRGYGFIPVDDNSIFSVLLKEKFSKDTHEALVFLRPIEEEEKECDHNLAKEYNRIAKIQNVVIAGPDLKLFEHCHECGEKLNG